MTKKREMKFDVNKAEQGIDTFEFKILFKENDHRYFEHTYWLVSRYGGMYGRIETRNGNVYLVLTLPHFIRRDNIQPFTYQDSEYLEEICEDCKKGLLEFFGVEVTMELCKIECNITHETIGQATLSDVLNFLNKVKLSIHNDNVKYVGPHMRCLLKEETRSVIIRHKHYWIGKFYDKTKQMEKKLIDKGKLPVGVPQNLLRIEIIMTERTIDNLFGKDRNLSDILTQDSLIKILREYKRIFYEFISKSENRYLDACVSELLSTLHETNSVPKMIAQERELIPDVEVLQKALKEWQKRKKVSNNSKRDAERYAEKFHLQRDVLSTMRIFKKMCG